MPKGLSICIFLLLALACRQTYEPPEIKANHNFLVMDGFINASPNGTTSITLSRTINLIDTIGMKAEEQARVSVEAKAGQLYSLQEQTGGVYKNVIPVNPSDLYRIKITTQDGKEYASDFVPVKQAPIIDSVTWKQKDDVTIYANTHDPLNKTRFYRWDYEETWEYRSDLETILGVKNGIIYYRNPSEQVNICWAREKSSDITLGTSVKLSEDKIDQNPVAFVPQNSEKIGIRYSILLNQYALTAEAYLYWEVLEKSTEKLGTLFDAQPSQLKGNIHCLSNPSEPVLGYLSASTVQSKRIFIANKELTNWDGIVRQNNCNISSIGQNPDNYLKYDYADTLFAPWYFVSRGIMLARKICVDCTVRGGSNSKPSFW